MRRPRWPIAAISAVSGQSRRSVHLCNYYNANDGKIGLIKMDIEGAEGRVLNSMLLLSRNPDAESIIKFSL